MRTIELNLTEPETNRTFPVMIYLPEHTSEAELPTVIFGNGFQEQERFKSGSDFYCKSYTFIAKFFTDKGYAFISVQFEIPGDADTLQNLDCTNRSMYEARKHLYIKDEKILLFVLESLKSFEPKLNLNKVIVSGHSNGGDVAQYFTNLHPDLVSRAIIFDGRRCHIAENLNAKLLRFEAFETSTDAGVFPDEGSREHVKRANIEWVIVKPKDAWHRSYTDRIDNPKDDLYNPALKHRIYKIIDWFLNEF